MQGQKLSKSGAWPEHLPNDSWYHALPLADQHCQAINLQ